MHVMLSWEGGCELKTAILAVLILFSTSCLPANAQSEFPFMGCWDWAGTNFADGSTETPASVGHGIQLCFHPDYTFERYHDEVVVEVSTWGVGCFNVGPYFIEFLWTEVGDYWHWAVLGVQPQFEMRLFDSVELPDGSGPPTSFTEVYFYRGTVPAESLSWGGLKAAYR